MIYNQFPDLQWLKEQAEKGFANRTGWEGRSLPTNGWPTVVLNVETRNIYRDNIRGPLSIFSNICGESFVEVENRRVKIKEDFYFITNHDQRYTLEADQRKIQTFNIHFGEYFLDQVFQSRSDKPERMLSEDCFITPLEKIYFHNRLQFKNDRFNRIINGIRQTGNDSLLLEEKLYLLASLLIEDHRDIKRAAEQLPVMKHATREEIVKRLLLSIDYIHTYYDHPISLDELSKTACLSKFHFLRLFKFIFRKTPHQFINEVRAEKAKILLSKTDLDVKAISRSLGFKDASTFSRMFYHQVGVYPSQYQ